jgi:hypothetical protein
MQKYVPGMISTCVKCGNRARAVTKKKLRAHWNGERDAKGVQIMCTG